MGLSLFGGGRWKGDVLGCVLRLLGKYKLELSVGSLQRCIELQMNSKLSSRKAKDFMVFETVKK